MATKDGFIGVFDSGVGGLSVLRQLRRLMPRERFLYFGDCANAPYGSKTTQQVQQLTMEAADMLVKRGCKALVIACNTATAAAIHLLRQRHPDLIVVGIEPAVKMASDSGVSRIGVMATPVTLREEKLAQLMERFPQLQLQPIEAPQLVSMIEASASQQALQDYLAPILAPWAGKLEAVVLGCTHYPFAAPAISALLGPEIQLLDGSAGTARQTKRLLEQADLLWDGPGALQIESSGPSLQTRAMALLQEEEHAI